MEHVPTCARCRSRTDGLSLPRARQSLIRPARRSREASRRLRLGWVQRVAPPTPPFALRQRRSLATPRRRARTRRRARSARSFFVARASADVGDAAPDPRRCDARLDGPRQRQRRLRRRCRRHRRCCSPRSRCCSRPRRAAARTRSTPLTISSQRLRCL